jgi:RNA polymerase sigma-70 factor (ECF subfamily)
MYSETNESVAVRSGVSVFQSTHWTVVLEAARQDSPSGQAALGSLCRTYWPPIYAFVRRSGYSRADAEDLTQDFFARLVEKNWLASITREGGKFRSVLITALKHFLAHARDHARAQKRGGGFALVSLDTELVERRYLAGAVDDLTPERLFEQRWALRMLENAMERLRQEYVRLEKEDLFEELKVFLSASGRAVSHAQIAAKHDISISAVGVAVHRMRRRFGELLRQQVTRTVSDPNEVDEELRHLIATLGR